RVRRDRLLLRSRDLQFGCAPGTGDDRAGLPGRDPQELIASITTEPEVIFGHGWELSSLHFGRSAGAILPQYSSLRASDLSCHTSARAGGGSGLACCKVGLGRPLVPAAFVAYSFCSARVSRPRPSADRGSRSARVSRPCRSADRSLPTAAHVLNYAPTWCLTPRSRPVGVS